jgi:hypothetical protein
MQYCWAAAQAQMGANHLLTLAFNLQSPSTTVNCSDETRLVRSYTTVNCPDAIAVAKVNITSLLWCQAREKVIHAASKFVQQIELSEACLVVRPGCFSIRGTCRVRCARCGRRRRSS